MALLVLIYSPLAVKEEHYVSWCPDLDELDSRHVRAELDLREDVFGMRLFIPIEDDKSLESELLISFFLFAFGEGIKKTAKR